ncbi:insulinase family protein [Galbibacter sp. BG1]|uniref:M16 family metallopeptidase n=1 Tax=Galbibacter sp. BG1 TaxID=1170699 RepID=UPI0015C191ED|nr:insulinase family protein [Galbibacter sp. BG1]QLE01992.1 insulinase family protein [Galbibacter sp. BG1]
MNTIKKTIFLLLTSYVCILCTAQSENPVHSATLPLDNSIRYGQLPNGFSYYIKSIEEPLSDLYLNLYVKAGTDQEDKSQLNFAHAIEHLAFKGTKNFPLGIRDSLKHSNIAITDYRGSSGETTNYLFKVPHNNGAVLDIALLWFSDIATGLRFTDEYTDQVKGELVEEFLIKSGEQLSESFATSSLEAELFPGRNSNINFFEHHKNYGPKELQKFYNDWYRPDLMAISVVGNIKDIDAMERRLKDRFSKIQLPLDPKTVPNSDADYYMRPPQFAIVERKTDTANVALVDNSVTFQLFFRAPSVLEKIHTMEGVKRLIKLKLLISIVNKRLEELTSKYNSFNALAFDRFSISSLPPLLEVRLKTYSREKEALQETVRALKQLQEYGILEEEWDEVKRDYLRDLNVGYENGTRYWNKEIFNHFKYNEALPSDKQENLKEWLSGLSLKSFNDHLFQFLSEMPKDIGIMAPTGHKALSLTENEIRFWIHDAYKGPVEDYKLPDVPKVLMGDEKVADLKEINYTDKGADISGARELLLNNGVRVILKPTSKASSNKVELHGFSPNGALSFPKPNQSSALNSSNIVRNAGVGKMDKFALKRFLSNTSIRVNPYTGFMETGIVGNAEHEDVEGMFQLIHLYFTAPRMDKVAYNDWKSGEKKAFLNHDYGLISADFSNSIRNITGDSFLSRGFNSLTKGLMGSEQFESIYRTDMVDAYEAYGQLFGSTEDFTFIITGDFSYGSMVPLVQKYLGNLPNTSKLSNTLKEVDLDPLPKGPVFKEITPPKYYVMKNVNYALKYISKATDPANWREQIKIDVLGKIIWNMAWDLRFTKGYNIYLITGFGKYNMDMRRYEIGFDLSCSNEELELLRKECKQIISKIKSGTVADHVFEDSRNFVMKNRINEQKRLYEHYYHEQPWVSPAERKRFIESLTIKDIVGIVNKYCNDGSLFEFVMRDKENL